MMSVVASMHRNHKPRWQTLASEYAGRARTWLTSADGRAFLASFLLHTALLSGLSFVVMKTTKGKDDVAILSQPGNGAEEVGFDTIIGGEDEVGGGGGSGDVQEFEVTTPLEGASPYAAGGAVQADLDLTATPGSDPSGFTLDNPTDLLRAIEDQEGRRGGRGRGIGSGVGNLTEGFAKPGGGRSVTRGKFAAWTVPSHPKPFQHYLIVIEVQWPRTTDKKQLRARANDISGTVEGTDSYFQVIEKTAQFVPKSSQFVIPVPGGERNIRDVIRVRSKLLEESQELEIVF